MWPNQSHGSLGPSCAIADVREGGATVWSSSQGPHALRQNVAKLFVDVVPFAHADEREEIGLAQLAQLARREVFRLRVVPVPQVQKRKEVGAFFAEFALGVVGLLLHVERALARVLDGEG